ncbi:MAG TPA: hypothetical protein VGE20_20260 [Ramlibacter sp.]
MRRRGLLTLGLVSAAVLAVGGGALALLAPGVQDGKLSPRGRHVMAAIGRAMLDGSLPAGEPAVAAALEGLLARSDRLVASLPPHAQSELSQLLALLGSAGGRRALAGLGEDWHTAPVTRRQEALQAMRVSGVALRQQAYQALHEIVGSAYFSEPATWRALGYPGPLAI